MADADGPDADGPMSRPLPCRRGLDPDGPAGDGTAAAVAIADPDARPVGPSSADPDATDVPRDVPPVADPALVADANAKPIPVAEGTPLADADPVAKPAPVTVPGPIEALTRLGPAAAEPMAFANAMAPGNLVTIGTTAFADVEGPAVADAKGTAIADVEGTAVVVVPLF